MVVAGAIYVIGGYGGGSTRFGDVWVSTDGGDAGRTRSGGWVGGYLQGWAARWAKLASFRATLAAVRLCGKLGLVGGYTGWVLQGVLRWY